MSKDKKETTEELQKKFEDEQKKAAEYLAGWQRERADFLNYKKEEMERISQLVGYATEELVLKILPILDNYEIALKNLPEDLKNDENVKGILQTKTQLEDFLKCGGVEEIKSVGEQFDPKLHEIAEQVEPQEGQESGLIVEEIQKGYKINDRLLRPARVKVVK